ncbi:MAG TPA: CPBP family intramembrane glutamic endopeptidase, partial [Gaiellales bacterium]|nr:CPBP family intramembrane glutamic endopeptidase [Gaiellales bacterium]
MNAVPNVDWRRGTAAGLLVVFVSFAAYVPAVLGAVAVPEGHEKLLRYGVVCVLLAPITALSVYAILKAVIGGRARPAWIGFAYPHRVISSVLLFFPLAFVALFVAGILTTVTGLQDEPTTAVDLTTKPEGEKLFLTFSAVVVAPWVEETAFRGLVYSSLAIRFGFWPAAIASSAGWSALHLALGVLIVFTAAGIVLCWLRDRTGSILPGVALHG